MAKRWWRIRRAEWLLAALFIALVAYTYHCARIYSRIGSLREEISERVGWTTELTEVEHQLVGPGDGPRAVPALDRVIAEVASSSAVRNGRALQTALASVRTAAVSGDAAATRERLNSALRELRSGSAGVSRELGGLVDESARAGGFGLLFGLASIVALASALSSRRTNDQLSRRAALLARAASAASLDWDPRTGSANFSAGWESLTGQPATHVQAWFDRVHPDDVAALRAAVDRHLAGETPVFEAEYRLRDASDCWRVMAAQGLAEREDGRAVRVAVAQGDITARRTQAAHEARSALLAHVSAATGMGFLAVDSAGQVHEANPAAVQMAAPWGSAGAFWSVLAGQGEPSFAPCALCGRPEPVGSATLRAQTPADELRFIQVTWTGHAHGLAMDRELSVAIVDDVTARRAAVEAERRAHARLVASEAELRTALDALPSALVVVGDAGIAFRNRTATATFGDAPEHSAALLAAAPSAPGAMRVAVLETRQGPRSFEVLAPVAIRFNGLPAELVLARDASDRARVESQLRAAERLVALGGLAAGLAHEINNPLTYVIGNLELATEGVGPVGERLARALDGAVRMRQVVAQLRDFGSPTPVATEPTDPGQVFEGALALARGVGAPALQVSRSFPVGVRVESVPVWLGQIALNLIHNALNAMEERPVEERRLEMSATADAATVTIRVRDNGGGVPEAIVGTLFDPFVSSRRRGEGQGLGLYLCRELATRMGGRLTLESTGPEGTTFALLMARSSAPRLAAGPSHPSGRARVLVAGRDADLASSLGEVLHRHEVRVETSPHRGRAALFESWDVAVIDASLMDGDGRTAWRQLTERDDSVVRRVVFVSSGTLTPALAEFMLRSSFPCLVRPFDLRDLVRLVDARLPNGVVHA